MKTSINQDLVQQVAASMTGKRLAKFLASVEVINASLAHGGWVKRGSVKAQSGFYQGLFSKKMGPLAHFDLEQCINYGHAVRNVDCAAIENLGRWTEHLKKPVSTKVLGAWVKLCFEVAAASAELDAARPLPVITPVGLSPKVTKTLTECGLDIELPSIKMAEIRSREVFLMGKDRMPVLDEHGEHVKGTVYYVAWTTGILFNKSRFAGNDCQACGKSIPSGRFVPIEATCRKNGLVALWVGCDCARNIFGIKDVGIRRSSE